MPGPSRRAQSSASLKAKDLSWLQGTRKMTASEGHRQLLLVLKMAEGAISQEMGASSRR